MAKRESATVLVRVPRVLVRDAVGRAIQSDKSSFWRDAPLMEIGKAVVRQIAERGLRARERTNARRRLRAVGARDDQ